LNSAAAEEKVSPRTFASIPHIQPLGTEQANFIPDKEILP
jgi:hypothetical protein